MATEKDGDLIEAMISPRISRRVQSAVASALKESVDPVLQTFRDLMTGPEFRQDKIDLELSQFRSAIARRNDDANAIPERELLSIVYGRDTPYGWEIEYDDLAHMHREDLVKFYQRYYFPKNILLAVYGDFSTAQMKDRLEKLFADWKVEQPPLPSFPAVTTKPSPGIYFAEKQDVTQTFFSIGELGGTLRDKDYPALQVAANILGQGFSSRLVSEPSTSSRPAESRLRKNALNTGMSSQRLASGGSSTSSTCNR